ncbi:MAG TPA: MBOAT family protein [Verrucomicrobiae bacterium]|nr:MBOAT family protein [Verrucomicrobiae bacterium]
MKIGGWVEMWALAGMLFLCAKWMTLRPQWVLAARPSLVRLAGYVFLWPGLDAAAFCGAARAPRPLAREWFWALCKTAFGAGLIWLGARLAWPAHPTCAAWIAMVGLAFLMHLGAFHLASLCWRKMGVNAAPIMRTPIAATSLGRFWGGRWNRAFTDLMQPHVFLPLAKRFGARNAMLAVFLASGLLHELVISLPARGGYGLPTAYFAIQAAGFCVERGSLGKRLGLGRGFRGWLFTVIVVVGPLPWLFHPVFVRNVILPMLRAIGAT